MVKHLKNCRCLANCREEMKPSLQFICLITIKIQNMTAKKTAEFVINRFKMAGHFKHNTSTDWECREVELAILRYVYDKDNHPKIVCLCGSTRFKKAFDEANYRETMSGKIVLSVGFSSGNTHGENIGASPDQKIMLDELHKRKIDISDEVLILNVGGYIGESTRSELNYAIQHGKIIRYLEKEKTP